MHFIETAVFTKRIVGLKLEGPLRRLQAELAANPVAGDLEPGTGGLRKVRLGDPGRNTGKRGGARVHYLYLARHAVIYLLFVYGKTEQTKLTQSEKKQLRAATARIKAERDARRG